MTFENLGLIKPLLLAVSEKGYTEPTQIQQGTIDTVLKGKDLMASAQTGTGKTAAFTLPLLQKLHADNGSRKHPRALVLTPTRELAAQVQDSVYTYGKHLDLKSLAVFGGVKIGPQITKLRNGIDILVATPGRLLDLYQQGAVKFSEVQVLILDEADRMLDMGFIHDIKRVQSYLPKQKQSLLFSATFSQEIRELAKTMLVNPVEVDVAPRNTTHGSIEQRVFPVDKKRKTELLSHLIQGNGWHQSLVFTKTKHGANRLVRDLLKKGIKAEAIHGNKSQAHRTRALEDFKRGKVSFLVATDIASRGLDINELPLVINFDLPHVSEDYVHRIGRTGRAGSEGIALSLVSADEVKQLGGIEKLIGKKIEREEIEGFEPDHSLPESAPRNQRGRTGVSKIKSDGDKPRRRQRRGNGRNYRSRSAA
jgi:ATP-dependent RNA helicase RhlE